VAPLIAPVTLGVKVTLKVQVAAAATVPPQGDVPEAVAAKSPLATILEISSVAPELLVRVTVLGALVVPTACDANARLVGDKTIGISPVPDTAKICGLPAPELAIPTAPLIDPVPDGVNVTDKVQAADLASTPPHGEAPLPTAAKSALEVSALIVIEPVLLLVTVMIFEALVAPTPVAVKVSDAGLIFNGTVGPPVAVPVSAMI
jgi:hypothetical protein